MKVQFCSNAAAVLNPLDGMNLIINCILNHYSVEIFRDNDAGQSWPLPSLMNVKREPGDKKWNICDYDRFLTFVIEETVL